MLHQQHKVLGLRALVYSGSRLEFKASGCRVNPSYREASKKETQIKRATEAFISHNRPDYLIVPKKFWTFLCGENPGDQRARRGREHEAEESRGPENGPGPEVRKTRGPVNSGE